MAGIHLPDIGKLGIHVATGVKDKKKVASMNNAEEARLKAFLKRVDTEEQERVAMMKKELKRMKRRKKRIDKRLQDLASTSLTIKGKHLGASDSHLPCIFTKDCDYSRRKLEFCHKGNHGPLIGKNTSGLVAKTTVFPIQDELDKHINIPSTSDYDNTTKLPYLHYRIPTNESQTGVKKQRKVSSVSKNSKDSFSKKTKKMSIANSENALDDIGCDGDQPVSLAETNMLSLDWENMPQRQPQMSLADAMLAIKTCRYLRTPSRQHEYHSENLE